MKFLSNSLFKGNVTVNGYSTFNNTITLTNASNLVTTNQFYGFASNHVNGIFTGYDSAAVYLGYSMGSVPVHIGSNGSGEVRIRTTGNTILESGKLLVGLTSDSGYKIDVDGNVRATISGYHVNNGTTSAPVITFNGSNKVSVDPVGYGTVMNHTLAVASSLTVGSNISATSYYMVKGGTTSLDTPFISYGIGRPEVDYSLQPLAGMGGYFSGASWYNGIGLTFYTSAGSDISGGANLAEVMRFTPAGVLSVTNLAGSGTRMLVANSSGVISTQSIPTGSLQGSIDADKTDSGTLSVGTTTVKSVSASTYSGVFFDYVVKNSTNVRVGSVVAITNGSSVEYYETLSNDLGSTTGITFAVDLSGGNIRLRATTSGTGWTAIVSTRAI